MEEEEIILKEEEMKSLLRNVVASKVVMTHVDIHCSFGGSCNVTIVRSSGMPKMIAN